MDITNNNQHAKNTSPDQPKNQHMETNTSHVAEAISTQDRDKNLMLLPSNPMQNEPIITSTSRPLDNSLYIVQEYHQNAKSPVNTKKKVQTHPIVPFLSTTNNEKSSTIISSHPLQSSDIRPATKSSESPTTIMGGIRSLRPCIILQPGD